MNWNYGELIASRENKWKTFRTECLLKLTAGAGTLVPLHPYTHGIHTSTSTITWTNKVAGQNAAELIEIAAKQ